MINTKCKIGAGVLLLAALGGLASPASAANPVDTRPQWEATTSVTNERTGYTHTSLSTTDSSVPLNEAAWGYSGETLKVEHSISVTGATDEETTLGMPEFTKRTPGASDPVFQDGSTAAPWACDSDPEQTIPAGATTTIVCSTTLALGSAFSADNINFSTYVGLTWSRMDGSTYWPATSELRLANRGSFESLDYLETKSHQLPEGQPLPVSASELISGSGWDPMIEVVHADAPGEAEITFEAGWRDVLKSTRAYVTAVDGALATEALDGWEISFDGPGIYRLPYELRIPAPPGATGPISSAPGELLVEVIGEPAVVEPVPVEQAPAPETKAPDEEVPVKELAATGMKETLGLTGLLAIAAGVGMVSVSRLRRFTITQEA